MFNSSFKSTILVASVKFYDVFFSICYFVDFAEEVWFFLISDILSGLIFIVFLEGEEMPDFYSSLTKILNLLLLLIVGEIVGEINGCFCP